MKHEGIQVRPATADDALAICDLHVRSIREVCSKDYPPATIAHWAGKKRSERYVQAMKEGEMLFVAMIDGRVIGFSAVRESEIMAVYVHPEFLRRGAGLMLMAALEQYARSRGVVELHMNSSLTAVDFYTACGYRTVERTEFAMGPVKLPCVKMYKRL